MTRSAAVLIAVLLAAQGAIVAAEARKQPKAQDLKRLTLEELMTLEVTLATRQPEPLSSAAAAISVITRDDIRRAGVTTIADALSLATGVHVARFNNGTWAISARGFNANTADKLLVMVDGRDEVTPLFTGVFWNILDYVLDDIDRIEVIRGAGATLWGANAVNGVVNVVTRHSRDTRGTLISAATGNEDPGIVEARYGGGSDGRSYRVYGKFADRDAQLLSTGSSGNDRRRRGQAGLRVDATQGRNGWMFKSDVFQSRDDFSDRRDGEFGLATASGLFTRQLTPGSRLQVSSHYRREYRNVERQLTHYLDTFDVDLQHSTPVAGSHAIVWGAAYRFNRDKTYGSDAVRFDPVSRSYPLYSAFAQDEWSVLPRSLFLTAGVKIEHNAFSGADLQPHLRVRWVMTPRQTLWGALARAARRPTRFDDDIAVGRIGGVPIVQGSDDFTSEIMRGVEVGYRAQVAHSLSLEATTFLQRYDRLRSQEAPSVGSIPLTIGNTLDARSSGLELSAVVQPFTRVRLTSNYSYLSVRITKTDSSRDVSNGISEGNDPHHLFSTRVAVDLPHALEVDAWIRHVSALPNPVVPAYTELNARFGWRPSRRVEVALVGQDLLNSSHPEFGPILPPRVEFQRSVRAVLTFRGGQ